MEYSYEAPSAAEFFHAADILGWDTVNHVVRRIQAGDPYAGYVRETFDRTGKGQGTHTHVAPSIGTLSVWVGTFHTKFEDPEEAPLIGEAIYAASPTGITHDSSQGAKMGYLVGPWVDHPLYYIVDTSPGHLARQESRFSSVSFTLAAADAGTQTLTIQALNQFGGALSRPVAFFFYLADDLDGLLQTEAVPDGGFSENLLGRSRSIVTGLGETTGIATTTTAGLVDVLVAHSVAAEGWYLVVILPDGSLAVSPQIIPTPV